MSARYRLVMVCAGGCERVYRQMDGFPVDIIGYYGMQRSTIRDGGLVILESHVSEADKALINERARLLRGELGFTDYDGDSVEFHASGMLTFPILGTAAPLEKKLAYDPGREKRRSCYGRVKEVFHDYAVFIGGSSSFDMAPPPFGKLYALSRYAGLSALSHDNIIYFGDDYGLGGNDSDVYHSDIEFVRIDDYMTFPEIARHLLL